MRYEISYHDLDRINELSTLVFDNLDVPLIPRVGDYILDAQDEPRLVDRVTFDITERVIKVKLTIKDVYPL